MLLTIILICVCLWLAIKFLNFVISFLAKNATIVAIVIVGIILFNIL